MATPTNQNTAIRPVNQLISGALADRKYTVRLTVSGDTTINGGQPTTFEANLPERYHIALTSSWTAPFAKTDYASLAGKYASIAEAAMSVTGIGQKSKQSSAQVWESSSPISLSLDMHFMAQSNTDTEIRQKHKLLLKLAAPSETLAGAILVAPGPTIAGAIFGGRNIRMEIGDYLLLNSVVIKGVSADMTSLCEAQGIPIGMTVNVDVESFFSCYTVQDIDAMFMGK